MLLGLCLLGLQRSLLINAMIMQKYIVAVFLPIDLGHSLIYRQLAQLSLLPTHN